MFQNDFLISDLDGTLLNDDKKISPQNMEAIKHFKRNGGCFTIATGRGYAMSKPVAKILELDIPAVIFNGAAVYDFKKENFLWHSILPEEAIQYTKDVLEHFPAASVEILTQKEVYIPGTINEVEKDHLAVENVIPIQVNSVEEVPVGKWLKVLVAGEPEIIDLVNEYADLHQTKGVHWVRSAPVFLEMLPAGVNKAYGMKKLLELTGNTHRFVTAVGDFMNDIEMLKEADLGVAVSNAAELVKKTADILVADNNTHAICDIVNYIEKKRSKENHGC